MTCVVTVAFCFFADHTMENMGISTGVWWKPSTPVACWGEYIAKRPALQECLEERK